MFLRSMSQTADITEQGKLPSKVSRQVEAGTVRRPLAEHRSTLPASRGRAR